jgi:MFS family permease
MPRRKTRSAHDRPPAPTKHLGAVAAVAPRKEPSNARLGTLLFLGLLVLYVANLRVLGAGDSIPTRLLPFSIIREQNLDLNEFTWEITRKGRLPYYVHQLGDRIYSVSTIGTPLAVVPLYVLPAWILSHYGIAYDDVRARLVIVASERFAAATMTALSALLLFVTARRLVSWRWALAISLTYGVGTSAWSISSQALWPHALSALCLATLSAIFVGREPRGGDSVLAGVVAALMVINRPQTAPLAALAAFHSWRCGRRQLFFFALAPAVAGALTVAYNLAVFRSFIGSYQTLNHFSTPIYEGAYGLLMSPNRGLFVFTPVMIFAFWGAVQVWRRPSSPWLRLLTIGIATHVLIHAGFSEWWAGYTYGPRYFADVLPGLALLLAFGLVPLCTSRPMTIVAAAIVAFGVVVQAIGVYQADDDWNQNPTPLEAAPRRVWDWGDTQIMRSVRQPWRGAELWPLITDVLRDPRPVMLAQLRPADLANRIAVADPPRAMRTGEERRLAVKVTNQSNVAWPAFSGERRISARYLVVVMERWFVGDMMLRGVGDVLRLPSNVSPGETLDLDFDLVAPSRPGNYEVEIRVSQAVDGTRGVPSPSGFRFPVRVGR